MLAKAALSAYGCWCLVECTENTRRANKLAGTDVNSKQADN